MGIISKELSDWMAEMPKSQQNRNLLVFHSEEDKQALIGEWVNNSSNTIMIIFPECANKGKITHFTHDEFIDAIMTQYQEQSEMETEL